MDSGVAKSCSSWTLECLDHYILRYNPVTPVKSQEDKELLTILSSVSQHCPHIARAVLSMLYSVVSVLLEEGEG